MIYEVYIPNEFVSRVEFALAKDGIPATKAEIEQELQNSLKAAVGDVEVSAASNAAAQAKRRELANEDWRKPPPGPPVILEPGVGVRDED